MAVPSFLVGIARFCWKWQWVQLMNGLGPSDNQGNYIRPASQYQNAKVPTKEEFSDRNKDKKPILIIGKSCPWAHRTWLVYKLRNLEEEINLFIAKPSPSKGKWALENGLLGCQYLDQIYNLCNSQANYRAIVPTLIDPGDSQTQRARLLGNESTQLIQVLNKWPTKNQAIDLLPEELLEPISKWESLLQPTVNDGVYKCGFARNQISYTKASETLFESLKEVETALSSGSDWLCGEKLTLADIRLFPTLIRWESVYVTLFGCSKEPLWNFPNIWSWRQRLFNIPEISATCDVNAWRQDYFQNLFPLRPSGIIPAGPSLRHIVNAKPPVKE